LLTLLLFIMFQALVTLMAQTPPPQPSAQCGAAITALNAQMRLANSSYYEANSACFSWDFDPKNEDAANRTCDAGADSFKAACVAHKGVTYMARNRLRMFPSENYHDRTSHVCLPGGCNMSDIRALGEQASLLWCKPFGMFLIDECDINYWVPSSSPAPSVDDCPADLNDDKCVNDKDITILLAEIGCPHKLHPNATYECEAIGPNHTKAICNNATACGPDLNHNGHVDIDPVTGDLALLKQAWGPCPGTAPSPSCPKQSNKQRGPDRGSSLAT
jgi:hypothetical protein